MYDSMTRESGPVSANDSERAALCQLAKILHADCSDQAVGPAKIAALGGEEIVLPHSVLRVLERAVYYLSRGQAVSLVPLDKELTTQQAADILNVSRPYLIKLLDQGAI